MKMKQHPPDKLWNQAQLYLDGQLSNSERGQFEQLMQENDEIREMVDYFRYLDEEDHQEEIQKNPGAAFSYHPIRQKLHYIARNYQALSALWSVNEFVKGIPPGSKVSIPPSGPSPVQNWPGRLIAKLRWLWSSASGKVLLSVLFLAGSLGGYQIAKELLFITPAFTGEQTELMVGFQDYPFLFGGGANNAPLEKDMEKYYVAASPDYAMTDKKIRRFLRRKANADLKEKDLGYYAAMLLYRAISLIHQNDLPAAINILRELNADQAGIDTIEDQVITFYLAYALLLNGDGDDRKEAERLLNLTTNSTAKLLDRVRPEQGKTVGELSALLLEKIREER